MSNSETFAYQVPLTAAVDYVFVQDVNADLRARGIDPDEMDMEPGSYPGYFMRFMMHAGLLPDTEGMVYDTPTGLWVIGDGAKGGSLADAYEDAKDSLTAYFTDKASFGRFRHLLNGDEEAFETAMANTAN